MKALFGIVCGALLVVTALSASFDLRTVSVTFGSCNITGPKRAYSYGVLLTVNKAQICATPSTFVATPLLEHEDVCAEAQREGMTEEQCRSRRGNYVTGGDAEVVSAEGLSQQNPNMKFLHIDKATQAPIELQLGTAVALRSGFITSGDQHANSHLPLNENSEILSKMKSNSQIVANSFGLDVGSQSYTSPRNGRLTFGGYQPAMVKGPRWEFKIDRNKLEIDNRTCPLQVDVREIVMNINGTEILLVAPDSNTRVCIEIYDRLIRLPSTGLTKLQERLRADGAKEVAQTPGKPDGRFGGILDTEPGLLYDTKGTKANLSGLVRSMQITLDNGLVGGKPGELKVNLGVEDLVQPLVGLNDEGVPAVDDTLQKLMVFQKGGIGNAAVLGRGFLEKLYLFVDYDKDVFYLGYLDQENRYQPAVSSGTCGTDEKCANHFGWLVALTVLIGLAVFAIAGLAWYLHRALVEQKSYTKRIMERLQSLGSVRNTPIGRETNSAPSTIRDPADD